MLTIEQVRSDSPLCDAEGLDDMAWVTPQFNRGRVDWAGRTLVKGMRGGITSEDWEDWMHALDIINNWRSAHGYPLNTFAVGLQRKARAIDADAIVAQRTKRLWSIWHKLDRFKSMQLAQMQDIAGCRAILSNSEQVLQLVKDYSKSSLRHGLRKQDNYILQPKVSGYRGVHIIWEYKSDKPAKADYNKLQVEMQLRTVWQHAWATTVETIGTFTRQALKSSIGEKDWLRFFALMGSVIALREGMPSVPDTPADPHELLAELNEYAIRVNARNRLQTIGNAIQTLEQPSATSAKAHFFLLELSPDSLKVTGFNANDQKEAQFQYLEVEKRIALDDASDAVLVSVDSVAALKRAYPNYFLDTRVFADLLEEALAGVA